MVGQVYGRLDLLKVDARTQPGQHRVLWITCAYEQHRVKGIFCMLRFGEEKDCCIAALEDVLDSIWESHIADSANLPAAKHVHHKTHRLVPLPCS